MYRFHTDSSYPELRNRNGRAVVIMRTITEPEPGFDAESLPMHKIRFADGYVAECWPDELLKFTATGPAYRDTL